MQIHLKIEANEIKAVPELSQYNYIVWEFIHPHNFGFTHLIEKYDDISDYPLYQIGVMDSGQFKCLVSGYGDPIPTTKIGWGGVWIDIDINRPDLTFELKCK